MFQNRKTEKMIIIDNVGDGGASKVTKNITNIMSEVPEVINYLTGIDIILIWLKI